MPPPRFSVIVPCLAKPAVLARLLTSLSVQTYSDFECIVADDASPESLEATAMSFSEKMRIKYYRNPENLGRARTRNLGISKAEGEILMFIDVDQIVDPTGLEQMASYFEDHRVKAVRADVSLLPSIRETGHYARYFNSRFLGQRAPAELALLDLANLPPKFFATDSVAVSASAVRELNGFLEEFRAYGCEDEEFGVRLSKRGVPLVFGQRVKVFDADESLSLARACKRMVEYAQRSAPILMRLHPDYADHSAFALLEKDPSTLSVPKRVLRTALVSLFRPSIAAWLVKRLEGADRSPRAPSPPWYQLALVGHYLIGYRNRKADQPS